MRIQLITLTFLLLAGCSKSGTDCEIMFKDSMGVGEGSPIWLSNGLTIAKVDDVELNQDSMGWVTVFFHLSDDYQLPLNSRFKLDPNLKGEAKIIVELGDCTEYYTEKCHALGELPTLKYLSPNDSPDDIRLLMLDNVIQKIEKHFTKEPDTGKVFIDTLLLKTKN
ncbi:MAG: hypothetical protein JKY54_07465 [Flavobacteriales bacterium]|nr:hypothetical protein [Flavobacteriales bacterium]